MSHSFTRVIKCGIGEPIPEVTVGRRPVDHHLSIWENATLLSLVYLLGRQSEFFSRL